ncbi:type II secretion system protein N [Sphingomonas arenae]|uniref:type II secretion system protein N n=1 Tax=Sphingomonas arenae TaxID=2812555 RepID=UPI001968A08A|nr:type II secretion system protein N [Sphingomonas arenae]
MPRDAYFWLKAVLLALIGVQVARVLLALVTPVGPIGQWMPPKPQVLPAAAQSALLSSFDPFGGTGSAVAGAVPQEASGFTLFGTRIASGGLPGSAIIAGPDGEQVSVAVGEQVAPGIKLVNVGFDRVVLERSGQRLQLAMEDSAAEGTAAAPGVATAAVGAPGALDADRLKEAIALAPRQRQGRVTGLLVSAVGDESVMQAAGLRSGDVIVAVNGRRVASVADASMLQAQVTPGARLSLTVERGAATVPVAFNLAGT